MRGWRRSRRAAARRGGRWWPRSSTALLGIVALLLAVVVVVRDRHPGGEGYFHFELGLYLRSVYGISFVLIRLPCALAVLVHVLIDQKYVGHFAMVLFLAISLLLPVLGVEHHLLRYGSVPAHPYSDMNGYGHFVAPLAWFELYWVAIALALAVVASLFWVRGTPQTFRERWREARARLDRRSGALLGTTLAVAAATGAFIFWNTNILNPYRTRFSREEAQAQYEKRYKARFEALPQPKVTAVKTRVDIFPPSGGWRSTGWTRSPTAPRSPSTKSWCASVPGPPCAP